MSEQIKAQTTVCDKASLVPAFLGFTRHQWFVLFAAWLGWGFDVFDALLFNYVSRICVPSLLGPGHDDAATITLWSGILTSVLLVGWAIGGLLFGWVTDRIGRSRTMLITIFIYALSTAACAFVSDIYTLLLFRFVASLGIGGEWAAGASLVSEVLPEKKRVQGGALLYTAAPAGLFLATFVTDLFTHTIGSVASNPDLSWRLVFLSGLIPASFAFLLRWKLEEPAAWLEERSPARVRDLFSPALRRKTFGGLAMASVALVSWWSCNAFIPVIASFLAQDGGTLTAGVEEQMMKAAYPYSTIRKNNLLDRFDAFFAKAPEGTCECVITFSSRDTDGCELREELAIERFNGATTITKKCCIVNGRNTVQSSSAVHLSPFADAVAASENDESKEGLLKSLIAHRLLGAEGLEFAEAYVAGSLDGLLRIKLAYFDAEGKELFAVAKKDARPDEARKAA